MIAVTRNHPSPVELSRAVCEGLEPALARHLDECEACATTHAGFARVDALAKELPTAAPPGDELLARILAAGTMPAKARRRLGMWLVPAGLAIAAAASAAIFARTDEVQPAPTVDRGPVYRGAVRAAPGARFVRVSSVPDEVVRLYEGTITVDVMQLGPGERFRVLVADAEIEGQRSSFEVSAKGDALLALQVVQGHVDVKPARRAQAVLLAGQRWEAEVPVEHVTFQERVVPAPAPTPRKAVTPAPAPPAELTLAELFDRGWKQLHAGDHRAAIETFDEALAKYPRDPLAEDVAFWRGVALARAKRPGEAIVALRAFLDTRPASPRSGEASTMLGWLLAEAGELDEAERRFDAGRQDPVPKVRASAQKGLAAIAAMRQRAKP